MATAGASPTLVDTHTHLDDRAFDADRPQVIARAVQSGVAMIAVGVDLASSEAAVSLAAQYQNVYAAVGVHPHEAATLTLPVLARLRELCRQPKVVAVGETGLDWYRNLTPQRAQMDAFSAHLDLAAEVGLPVIIHNRQADADVLRLWRAVPGLRGVLHAFSSDDEMADAALAAGLHIAFGGPLTYRNADTTRRVAARVPLDRLLVETDCPLLPPVPWRGRRNEPAYVALVVEALVVLRGEPLPAIAAATTRNAAALFTRAGLA